MTTKRQKEWYKHHKQVVFTKMRINNNEYNWLRRKAEVLRKIYEQDCNGDLSESLYEKLTNKYYKEIDTFAHSLGLKTFFQTDPRGASLYIDIEEIPENNYTNAYCIY